MEISASKIRKSINRSTIIEISGPDNTEKANKLADKLQEVLKEEAHVTRPVIKGELHITGLDESVTDEEVQWMVSKEDNCNIREVKVSQIRMTRNNLGVTWVRCPLQAAMDIARKGKVLIGWSVAKVELLKARPLQCFRCWQQGHVRTTCRAEIDLSRCCFQCGQEGHTAVECNNRPKCRLCANLKVEDNRRVGSPRCVGVKAAPVRDRTTTSSVRTPLRSGGPITRIWKYNYDYD